MRPILTFVLAFTFSVTFGYTDGNDDSELLIEREGNLIYVLDFKEGDKIKLFEVNSGEHILSKTRGQIDLSQLPVGEYLLENNEGKSVVIRKNALQLVVQHVLGDSFVVEQDSQYNKNNESLNSVEDLKNHYIKIEGRLLSIDRDVDVIKVTEFKEGDKIKLFELDSQVHVISKTTDTIDLSQLPIGVYLLENNRGQSVVIEKVVDNSYSGI